MSFEKKSVFYDINASLFLYILKVSHCSMWRWR